MSPRLRQASLQNLLDHVDLVDVISGYTSLRKRGATHLGLCPFHQEKTPSFSVSADKGLYYCFGCGEGGNVLTFLQRVENLSFMEAAEQLAERFGVPLEYEEGAGPEPEARDRERRLLSLLEKTAAFYARFLWESSEGDTGRTYLQARGLDRAVCEEFRVGLSPSGWRGLYARAIKDGVSERDLEASGLLVRQPGKVYDRFRGRLMFPLTDHRGRVVGFGGRTLGAETPKYVNSPEGPLYQKGRLLYGLHQARRAVAEADEVLVVEGYTDVLALAQAGVRNVVASMGTALTAAQLELVSRFTRNVTFMFDADRAGAEAALRSGELARRQGLRALVVILPSGLDPADAARERGADGVKRLIGQRVSLLGYEVRRVLETSDTASSTGRVEAFDRIRGLLRRATSPKEVEEEVRVVADRLRLSPDNVRMLLGEGARAAGPGAVLPVVGERRGAYSANAGARQKVPPPGMTERVRSPEAVVEREFLIAAVSNPAEAFEIAETLSPEHFVDPVHTRAFLSLREALTAGAAGLGSLVQDHGEGQPDPELGRLMVRLAMEADPRRYTVALLKERTLRLREHHLARAIATLRRRLEEGDDDADTERSLVRLEHLLHEVRAALAGLEEE